MGRTASSVGMMEGAFFVSRTELVEWVNRLLQVNLAKVEQCASGAIYCQIIDACHPGSISMRKVNWMAKAEHEHIPNYKVLQAAFDKLDIARHIPVDQLIRGKYQDNLEMLQWLKCYWEKEGGAGHRQYDAVTVRADKTLPPWAKPLNIFAARGTLEKENQNPRMGKADEVRQVRQPARPAADRTHGRTATSGNTSAVSAPAVRQPTKTPRSVNSSLNTSLNTSAAENETLKAKLQDQKEEILDLRANLDGLERERDYYFRKLRDVEILCLELKANMDPELKAEKVVEDVQGILYAENEVEAETDEANL